MRRKMQYSKDLYHFMVKFDEICSILSNVSRTTRTTTKQNLDPRCTYLPTRVKSSYFKITITFIQFTCLRGPHLYSVTGNLTPIFNIFQCQQYDTHHTQWPNDGFTEFLKKCIVHKNCYVLIVIFAIQKVIPRSEIPPFNTLGPCCPIGLRPLCSHPGSKI
jgi:hypothetical protein